MSAPAGVDLAAIVSQLADRVAHLESRVDQADIPYRPDLTPEPGAPLQSMVDDLAGRVFIVTAPGSQFAEVAG